MNEPERRDVDARLEWDDIVIGYRQRSVEYLVEEPEMIEFAAHFDPMPIHINPMAAAKSQFGTVTASGSYMLALRQKLAHQFAFSKTVIASIGLDEVRFVAPLRAGQRCQLEIVFLDKRPSHKREDRGVVTIGMALIADHQPVLTLKDIVLVWRRVGFGLGSARPLGTK